MPDFDRDELRAIKTFPQLIKYLQDELDWPIEADDFEEITFDYEPEELGIDPESAAKIQEIKQLRPLTSNQPWGIFFIKFEPKRLPVVVLRRILSKLVIKKRASAKISERAVWDLHDLLFISNYGEGDQRQITFANFSQDETTGDLPTLKVLGWDYEDTGLHIDNVHDELTTKLRWPDDEKNIKKWRETWSSAFILRNREVITTSKDLAIRLAALAQRIRQRAKKVLELENANGAMQQLYRAFRETLISDLKEDDFADMYAQTIAYGLLAARMSRPMGITSSNIKDMVPNTNPFLREILGTFIATGGRKGKIDFDELGVQDIVETLNSPDTHMGAVLLDFGNRTKQEDPVVHFYELFLSEYDKKKKVQRGVFYTPQPVVSYIVRSVNELLQKEFGLPDGLADITTWGEMTTRNKNIKIPEGVTPDEPFVQILDPAVGTATFLVEVIDIIYKTMMSKWLKQGHTASDFPQLWNEYVTKHLLPRLYGYELMMAPYAIAHMRLGLKLFETGYKFGAETPRANVYLTNSLEPAGEVGPHRKFELLAPALAHEARAVNEIKWKKHFTIVIGNPPYSVISANMGQWIASLCDGYKTTVRLHERQIQALSDDYVKFLRFMQWNIERSQCGIVGVITNNGYLDGHLFIDTRSTLRGVFDKISILNLHGNSRTQEKSPDGTLDDNVFDIQTGVAVTCFCRTISKNDSTLKYLDLWGTRSNKYLALSLISVSDEKWQLITTKNTFDIWIPIVSSLRLEWDNMYSLLDIFGSGQHQSDSQKRYAAGFVSQQDDFAIAFSKEDIKRRLEELLRKDTTETVLRTHYKLCSTSQWNFARAREELSKENIQTLITSCMYRPFDKRWTVYHRGVVSILRKELLRHLLNRKNIALLATRGISRQQYAHIFISNEIVDRHALDNASESMFVFPLFIYPEAEIKGALKGLFTSVECVVNFSSHFLNILHTKLNLDKSYTPEELFNYMYAVFYSSNYRRRYYEFLKSDFPRLPLTNSIDFFHKLSGLGCELGALHLMESSKLNALITIWQGSQHSCEVGKISYSDQTVWIDKAQLEGFRGVPENVWNFHIGGYQVCEKWLKDRKGRVLSDEDINHYQKIVVALNETIRIMKEIDEIIDKYGGWPGAFQ